MSTCRQAIAMRRRALHDVRYVKSARRDVNSRNKHLAAVIQKERELQSRSKKK